MLREFIHFVGAHPVLFAGVLIFEIFMAAHLIQLDKDLRPKK